MKRIGIVACLALTLCTTAPQQAQACCGLLWAIPLALGVGAAIGSAFAPRPAYVYPPPTYVYSPPVYSYSYSYAPPAHTSAPAANTYSQAQPTYVQRFYPAAATQTAQVPRPAQQVVWTPRTGTGHWVPDPQPYAYLPQKTSSTTALASKVSSPSVPVSGSAGSVPAYVVSR